MQVTPLTKRDSDLALIWDTEANLVAGLSTVSSRWGSKELSFTVQPYDSNDPAFLGNLRRGKEKIIVAFRTDAAICSVIENVRITEVGKSLWELHFGVMISDFTPSIEMSFASTSADELAVMRARRILLNENPAPEDLKSLSDINAITRELFIGGQGTYLHVQRSPFPVLFQQHSADRERFLDLAWINAVANLKLTATVETIELLELILLGESLQVEFRGKRKRKYSNVPPFAIEVSGICPLLR